MILEISSPYSVNEIYTPLSVLGSSGRKECMSPIPYSIYQNLNGMSQLPASLEGGISTQYRQYRIPK